jgi:hypothetical protein
MLLQSCLFIYLYNHSFTHLQGYNGGNAENPCLLGLMPAVLYKFKEGSGELMPVLSFKDNLMVDAVGSYETLGCISSHPRRQ